MIEHIHPGGEPVPTVAELYARKDGSAEVVTWVGATKTQPGKPGVYRLLPKGQAVISEIMARNAAGTIARGSATDEGVAAMIEARRKGGEDDGSAST